MKLCLDCKNWLKCEKSPFSCENWEPTEKRKAWLLGYLDGFDDGAKGYDQRRKDAIDRLIEVKDWLSEHELPTWIHLLTRAFDFPQNKEKKNGNETREGEEMEEIKYSVIVDNETIAQHMTLEIASILVQALFEIWQNSIQMAKKTYSKEKIKCSIKEVIPVISIARESEEENV